MSNVGKFVAVVVFIFCSTACSSVIGRTVTVKVVDNDGEPVPSAKVEMGFLGQPGWGDGEEVTDEDGIASRRGNDSLGVRTFVTKTGYYKSETRIGGDKSLEETILLREKKNPVPMYARKVNMYFPKKDDFIGFDLKKGDWVSPYGQGKKADILFMVKGGKNEDEGTSGQLTVRFPGDGEGILLIEEWYHDSRFKTRYKAKKEGYQKELRQRYWHDERGYSHRSSTLGEPGVIKGYLFRVEASKNKDKGFYYGKIVNDIGWSPVSREDRDSSGLVQFQYYLNSEANDRNIEFDPGRNMSSDANKVFAP